MERNYSLVNWPRSTIELIWGQGCANITADVIPDTYKFGASGEYLFSMETCVSLTFVGTCRVFDGKTSCKKRFPPSLDLAKAVLQDLDAVENSEDTAALQSCRDAIDKPIDHKTADKLAIVMVSFVLVSIFINLTSFIVAAVSHPWSITSTCVLGTDVLFIFASLVLCIATMNYEGGGYLKEVHGSDFSDKELIGIGIWMLLAMLIGRVLSNPWLLLISLAILLPIALVFVLFLVRTRGFFAVVRAAAYSDE